MCPAFKDTFLLGNCAIRILRFSSPGRSSFTAVWKHRPSQLHNTNPGLALKSLNLLEWAPPLTPKGNYLKIPKANPSSLFQDCVQGKVWRLPRVTPDSCVGCQQVCWECFNGSWAMVMLAGEGPGRMECYPVIFRLQIQTLIPKPQTLCPKPEPYTPNHPPQTPKQKSLGPL